MVSAMRIRSISFLAVALLGVACTKSPAPTATTTTTTTPAPAGLPPMAIEQGIDRPGEDFKDFDLDDARPEVCRDACEKEPQCKAFTFVKAGVQGDKARCWLKTTVPAPVPGDCCASGFRK